MYINKIHIDNQILFTQLIRFYKQALSVSLKNFTTVLGSTKMFTYQP